VLTTPQRAQALGVAGSAEQVEFDRYFGRVVAALGEERTQRILDQASQLTIEDAIAYSASNTKQLTAM
jgi:hypothetical protein